MQYAPIIIFAFNRLEPLKNTVTSLLNNVEAKESNLFIFVDGARLDKKGERETVLGVQNYVKTITGFKSVHYSFSSTNKGLASSIITGVTEIVNRYGQAIVLEDDLRFTMNFLSFMNQGLDKYYNNKKVFSICGYSNSVKCPADYLADAYFCTRSSSWGWATWADRWNSVDWELEPFEQYKNKKKLFNKWGGSDCFGMLKDWHDGKNNSWAIRFCFSQFLQDKISLFPMTSKVVNDGFDGQGTNCKKWSRFKYDLDEQGKKNFIWPENDEINIQLYKSAMGYHSIIIRIWSKLQYILHQ